MPTFQKPISVTNKAEGVNDGIPFSFDRSFTVSDMRNYGKSRNTPIFAGGTNGLKTRAVGVWKRITYKVKPVVMVRVREPNRQGKWVNKTRPLTASRLILVYPKRRGKTKKRPRGKKPVYHYANALSRETWEIGRAEPAEISAYYLADKTHTRSMVGNLILNTPPWNSSGVHFFNLSAYTDMSNSELEIDSQAKNQLLERIHDQDVNVAQAFAERRQTVGMIADAAVRLGGAIRAAKRGNLLKASKMLFPDGKNPSKQLANDWLVLQYGIKPLISDVEGMAVHLAKMQFKLPTLKSVAHKEAKKTQVFHTQPTTLAGAGSVTIVVEKKTTVKYVAEYEIQHPTVSAFSKLGLTNPAQLAWELIPFSFVVDWFLPIGDYLTNLSSGEGIKLTNHYKTITKSCTVTVIGQYNGDAGGWRYSGTPFSQRFKKFTMTREILTALPSVPLPQFKDPVSAGHIANAVALLRQLKR